MTSHISVACIASFVVVLIRANFKARDGIPRPLLPKNRRSLNRDTLLFITAVAFRSSAEQFSSFPAITVTCVPSGISDNATTEKRRAVCGANQAGLIDNDDEILFADCKNVCSPSY